MKEINIVIGLGNPGLKYEETRHNIGFKTIDNIATKIGIEKFKSANKAFVGEVTYKDKKVILAKPQTYMNLSGESVREIMEWYKAPINNIIVIYDDIDINVGNIRIRSKGSAGSHNGMKSIIQNLKSDNFPRVRIGVGRPPQGWDLADYVLGKFAKEEISDIEKSISLATESVLNMIEYDINVAMNKLSAR